MDLKTLALDINKIPKSELKKPGLSFEKLEKEAKTYVGTFQIIDLTSPPPPSPSNS